MVAQGRFLCRVRFIEQITWHLRDWSPHASETYPVTALTLPPPLLCKISFLKDLTPLLVDSSQFGPQYVLISTLESEHIVVSLFQNCCFARLRGYFLEVFFPLIRDRVVKFLHRRQSRTLSRTLIDSDWSRFVPSVAVENEANTKVTKAKEKVTKRDITGSSCLRVHANSF